ncbi:MAG: hydrogenase [Methanobrevibacter sp.]|uniref:hydrogenase n=1 Tax=Methanobrevibacter sp. TaxID=66852 RepID=UPI0026DEE206|nr:hydrogenase [Methanobrevibacter sp.]MDO5848073.1 hydrogenase [Methanobrevibacter sp.]
MWLYDKFFDVVKKFRQLFAGGPVTNIEVSGTLTAEFLIIVSFCLVALLLRHVNVLVAGMVTLILAVILVINMPLIPKFKIEQEDSLNKMVFYAILTLAIIVVFIYWGAQYV